MSRNKAILLIAGIVIFLIAGIVYVYFQFMSTGNGTEQPDDEDGRNGGITIVRPPGTGTNGGTGVNNSQPGTSTSTDNLVAEFRKVADGPIAGAVTYEKSNQTFIRYVERASGHIYETTTTSKVTEKISTTRISKVVEAMWTKKADSVYARYIGPDNEIIQTYYGKLTPVKAATTTGLTEIVYAEQELRGNFFPAGISQLSVSPAGDKSFYIQATKDGTVQGAVAKIDGTARSIVWNSPITEWISQWPKDNTVTLTTKAAQSVPGFVYFLNPSTGSIRKIFGNINGFTTLTSPAASSILYSGIKSDGTLGIGIYDVTTAEIKPFPLQTLPEKCVWSKKISTVIYCAVPQQFPSGTYPDSWYQGEISFADDLWKIDLSRGTTTYLANPAAYVDTSIDAVNPYLTEKEDYLLFTDKNDGSLWSLKLTNL